MIRHPHMPGLRFRLRQALPRQLCTRTCVRIPRPQLPLRPQFRLRPGHDDALIRWLGSLSPRQRSRAIRTALCRYLAEQSDRRPAERREDPDLAHALDSLF